MDKVKNGQHNGQHNEGKGGISFSFVSSKIAPMALEEQQRELERWPGRTASEND